MQLLIDIVIRVAIAVIAYVVITKLNKRKEKKTEKVRPNKVKADKWDKPHHKYRNLTMSMYWALAEKRHAPEYAIEWLDYSLSLGRGGETWFYWALQSAESNFPYLCESEEEYEWFKWFDDTKHIAAEMSVMGSRYLGEPTASNYAHPYKLEYWRNQFMELVQTGDKEANDILYNRDIDGEEFFEGMKSAKY